MREHEQQATFNKESASAEFFNTRIVKKPKRSFVAGKLCQQREIILLTANRHDEGPDSLEATIRALNVPSSLPVLTIADPERVLASRD